MKRFFKTLYISIGILAAFILVLSLVAKIFEDDVAKIAIKKVSKSINAPVEIGAVNVNLVRGFPRATIKFNNLYLKDPEQLTSDTIAGIKSLFVSINSRAALKGQYVIERIIMDGLTVNYTVDQDSISNIDFLMSLLPETDLSDETTTDSSLLYVNLNHIIFKDFSCAYFDGTSNTGGKLHIPNITLTGNIMGDDYTIESDGKVTLTDLRFGETNIDLMKEASLDFSIKYEGEDMMINNCSLISDGVEMEARGTAKVADNIYIDAQIDGTKIDFNELSKYIPQEMMDEFGLQSANGLLTFSSTIKGEYNDSIMPQVDAHFELTDGAIETRDYPSIKQLTLKGSASNGEQQNNASSTLNIESFNAATAKSHFNLKMSIKDIDQPIYKLNSKGSVLIEEFAAFIPDSTIQSISGRFTWAMGTSGRVPKEIGDDFSDYMMARTWANLAVKQLNIDVDSSLSIEKLSGELAYHPNNIVVKDLTMNVPSYNVSMQNSSADIGFNGSVNNTDAMSCDIRNMHLEMEDNILDFSASLSNLIEPYYTFDGTMQLSLDQLQKLAPDTLITSMDGQVSASLISAGTIHLDSIETQGMEAAFKNSIIDFVCKDINISSPDTMMAVNDFNLNMTMKPDTITVPHFSANYKGMSMLAENTTIINAYNTTVLNKKEELEVFTSIKIGDVDFALLESLMEGAESTANAEATNDSTTDITTNYTMDIRGDMAIKSFSISDYEVDTTITIRQLDITNFATDFRVTDSTYIVDSLEFNAFGGYLNTSMRYDIKQDHDVIAIRNHIDGMDFKQLLYDMDNLGQSDLTYENISGVLDCDLHADAKIIGDSVPMDKVRVKGDFKLTEGGVYDFEPATELSKFTGIKELDNIVFQTLKTQLFVYKGAAYMPKTEIVSSAVDLTAFGMQSFGDDYEYYVKLNLGDVLTGKSENLMKRQAEAEKDANEEISRNGANLVMYSLEGKTKNGFDNKKEREKMLRKVRLQERVVDLVFHPKLIDFNTEKKTNE